MKVFVGSDLHIEFWKKTCPVDLPEGDVLLLAGDIFVPANGGNHVEEAVDFLEKCGRYFGEVLMVCGNHEFYHGYADSTHNKVREIINHIQNVHLLENSAYQVGDIVVWGSTFWTDIKNNDPIVAWDVGQGMNDYVQIHKSRDTELIKKGKEYVYERPKFRPEHTVEFNKTARTELELFLSRAMHTNAYPIIMTHHAPSWESVAPVYRGRDVSYAYANTGLDALIEQFEGHWVHGHTHIPCEYQQGLCKIVCNPFGYLNYEVVDGTDYRLKELTLPDWIK